MDLTASWVHKLRAMTLTFNICLHSSTVPGTKSEKKYNVYLCHWQMQGRTNHIMKKGPANKDSKEKVGPSSICKQKVKGGGMTSLKVAGVVQGGKGKVFFIHFFEQS